MYKEIRGSVFRREVITLASCLTLDEGRTAPRRTPLGPGSLNGGKLCFELIGEYKQYLLGMM